VVEKPKRHKVRARTIIGIVAGLAVVAGAGVLATGSANADTSGTPGPITITQGDHLKGLKVGADSKVLPAKDMPKNARRATSMPTKFGKRGPAFQPKKTKSTNITGGTPANASDFPSVVGIESFFYVDDDGDGTAEGYVATCTGTVLSSTRILTAGHCIVDLPYGTTFVIAGRNNLDLDTNGFVARVSNTYTDPHFNYEALSGSNPPAPANDVSVLTLKDALPAAYTPTAIAAQGAADPAADTSATIVGYGRTARDTLDEGILRSATVPIKADSECTATWGTDFNPTKNLCAGTPPTTDTCAGDSGGPIFTGDADSRVQVGITDWGAEVCGSAYGVFTAISNYSASIKAQVTLAGPNQLDFTGDGHADLFGRLASTGQLDVATGAGFATNTYGGVSGPHWIADGGNWNRFSKLFRVNNWGGDKTESVFARDSAGKLYNYRSDGAGNFIGGTPPQIGSGWNMFNDIMVTNNWIGNGLPNLIGRKPNGDLILYNANGHGGWLNPKGTQIGTAWGGFNAILTPGSWLGDGRQSLIGRKTNGELWLYTSNGHGGWADTHGKKIGTGWGGFPTFLSPGDWSGDNLVDMIGVTSAGDVRLYTSNGKGGWINGKGTVIDRGWKVYNTVF
jgi:V8-like Glu-specific endopeptidase